jgi:hypothetical protein
VLALVTLVSRANASASSLNSSLYFVVILNTPSLFWIISFFGFVGVLFYDSSPDPEYAVEITAEELLDQEVRSVSFSKGTWRMLSDYIREPEQEQPPFEQGVTMC